ncbi:protein-tyrosine phosphatase family protein [Thermococcus sp.]
MFRYWWLDGKVAFSGVPPGRELDSLAGIFDAVVPLVEKYELPYPLEEWGKRSVEIFHSPIPDFLAPSLNQLFEILRWIETKTVEGKNVLVHCSGGCGRSGTVAVAWLMYSKGLSLGKALLAVRKLRPCAVETRDQIEVLKKLEKATKVY